MKIVFLQQVHDAMGGAVMVNCSLARAFLAHEHEVCFLSVRSSGRGDSVPYPIDAKQIVVNQEAIWDVPRLNVIKKQVFSGKLGDAFAQVKKRKAYDRELKMDYEACGKQLEVFDPDAVICSHYECLDAIPPKYLKRTINHYHTTFSQVLENKSQIHFLNRYQDKIGRFLWLSKFICDEAKQYGYENSSYIYNPIRFQSTKLSDVGNLKQAVFVGRFSSEKRVDLLVKMFDETINEYKIKDWNLTLVGYGELNEQTQKLIDSREYLKLLPPTSDVKALFLKSSLLCLTSRFEGFPLVILEAGECGVPTLAFEFSKAIHEEIEHDKNGVVVEQDQQEMFKKELAKLMIHDELRVSMGSEAKIFAQKFRMDVVYQEWMKLFEEMRESE